MELKVVLSLIIFALNYVDSTDLSYTLRPLEGHDGFGAEILGLNIKEVKVGEHDDLIQQIKDDLNKYSVLVLKDQGLLTNKELHNITGWWGELNCNGPRDSDDRCVFRNTNGPSGRLWSDRGRIWHIDSSHKERIDNTIVYHIQNDPPEGPTLVMPLYKCVDLLTHKQREQYEGLWYVMGNGLKKPFMVVHPATEQVVFRVHFFSVREFIWNHGTDKAIHVTDRQEINKIKHEFYQFMEEKCKGLSYAHTWEQGDVAFIDNMACSHRADDSVPQDGVKDDPNILLRVSAYSPITREPAKGYVPRAERDKGKKCAEGDKDCEEENKQKQDAEEDAKKDEL